MSDSVKFSEYYTIKNGEIKDYTIKFTGELNSFIADYLNDPVKSPMHKALVHSLKKVIQHPVSIVEVEDDGNKKSS